MLISLFLREDEIIFTIPNIGPYCGVNID